MKTPIMKPIIAIAVVSLLTLGAKAQTTEGEKMLKTQDADTTQGWKTGGNVGLAFGQVALKNWAGGGLNSINITGAINLFADYRKDKHSWENNLDLAYGVIKQGDKDAPWIKNDDRIDFTSKYGYQLKKNLYAAALYNFRSQFAPGYATPLQEVKISDFAAPAYSLFAVGIDYKKGPFSAFLAPATLKTTIVADQDLADAGAFGVEGATFDETTGEKLTSGKNMRNEFGGYLKLRYKKDIIENVNLETKADFFSNYLENPQYIDVNWQVLIAMKVNKYITATVSTHLIYDHDIDIAQDTNNDGIADKIGPAVQFKEALNVGFSYQF